MHRAKNPRIDGLLYELRRHYYEEARTHLPWRLTRDPYKILVSEIMLQQTQVERVVPYYRKFVREFASAKKLAAAPLSAVLRVWQGLGYNRRAKYLHDAAKQIAKRGFPKNAKEMEELPGVGYYTARAVAAFAYNQPEVFVETNIRTVFFHHLGTKRAMSDKQLLPLVAAALQRSEMDPRDFYAALMDYGTHLKKRGIRLNKKSAHYVPQSKFEGSARQLRGAILRELLLHQATLATLAHKLPRSRDEVAHELMRLVAEGLVQLHGRYFGVMNK